MATDAKLDTGPMMKDKKNTYEKYKQLPSYNLYPTTRKIS